MEVISQLKPVWKYRLTKYSKNIKICYFTFLCLEFPGLPPPSLWGGFSTLHNPLGVFSKKDKVCLV